MNKKIKIIRVSILIIMLIFSALWVNEFYTWFANFHDSNTYFLVYLIPSIVYIIALICVIKNKNMFNIYSKYLFLSLAIAIILFALGLINTYSDIARSSKNLFCIISFSILPYAFYYAVDLGETFFKDFKENDDQL